MRRAAALLVLALLPSTAAATDPLQMPASIVLPQEVDAARLKGAILQACTRRKWLAESHMQNGFVAALYVRDHVLKIRIEYAPREIRFVYVDSTELDYEIDDDGVPQIHYKANKWLAALGTEVRRQVQLVAFDGEELAVVPAEPPPPAAALPQVPPPASPTLQAGTTARLDRAQPLRSRPMADADTVLLLEAGAGVQLVSPMRNLSGVWWYVNTGAKVGWLPEAALRPSSP